MSWRTVEGLFFFLVEPWIVLYFFAGLAGIYYLTCIYGILCVFLFFPLVMTEAWQMRGFYKLYRYLYLKYNPQPNHSLDSAEL